MNGDAGDVMGAKGAMRLCFPPPGILVGDTMYIPLLPALPILPAFFVGGPGGLTAGGQVRRQGVPRRERVGRAPVW